MIERTDSLKMIDPDTVKDMRVAQLERQNHVYSQKYQQNVQLQITSLKKGPVELVINEEASVYDDIEEEIKSIIDDESAIKDEDYIHSQTSSYTFDLVDKSGQSSSLQSLSKLNTALAQIAKESSQVKPAQ